jgi:hypothetical protein
MEIKIESGFSQRPASLPLEINSQPAVEMQSATSFRGLFRDLNALLKLLLMYHHSKICGPESDSSQDSHHGCMIPHDCLSMKLWIYHEMVCSKGSQDCDQCRFIEVLKCTSSLFMSLIRTRGLHTPTKKQLL